MNHDFRINWQLPMAALGPAIESSVQLVEPMVAPLTGHTWQFCNPPAAGWFLVGNNVDEQDGQQGAGYSGTVAAWWDGETWTMWRGLISAKVHGPMPTAERMRSSQFAWLRPVSPSELGRTAPHSDWLAKLPKLCGMDLAVDRAAES